MGMFNIAAYVNGVSLSSSSLGAFLPAKCPLQPKLWSRKRKSNTLYPLNTLFPAAAIRREEENSDDDDAVIGGKEQKFGMAIPHLTEAEHEYLEAATSSRDYMRRMTDIVRKKDQERRAAMSRESAQGPDDYLASLARPTTPTPDTGPPRINAGDAYMEGLARKSRANRGLEEQPVLPHRRATAPAGSPTQTDEQDSIEREDVEARINRLQDRLARVKDEIDPNSTIEDAISEQEAIRRDMGLDPAPEPTLTPPTELASQETPKPQAIEKQIDFLENYLERLKREEAKESTQEDVVGADVPSATQMKKDLESKIEQLSEKVTPQIEGLGDTPGGMSSAEKKAAFQQLREQAMKASTPDSRFLDPYNTVLPTEEAGVDDGDEPSPSSEAEYEEIGSQLHNKDLLVEEIEVEVARYVADAKSLLQKHDARMQVLLARLRALN
eukprot:TRINITY_DN2518_c0_g1_i1.p3 TRINITY_DN2518_c0_g1~~TRINITY_DN2518_c0_g1_i1.p3  ORF type:complete len:440 (+),score=86.81 TRINITY_DN2518_c0_g1_i1:10366-11685(+)